MRVKIIPADIGGTVCAVPSKSVAHRALICAALSDKPTVIKNLFSSQDIVATKECLSALGAEFDGETVYPIKKKECALLDCNESGSTLRFMLPVALALGGEFEFLMRGRLSKRPLSPLYEELLSHGCNLSEQGTNPIKASGKIKSGIYNLPGNISSQFITGLLLSLPILEGDSQIRISGELESAPYIDITRKVQESFGVFTEYKDNVFYIKGNQKYISCREFSVEGDWSNAAVWFCADSISNKEVICKGVTKTSAQGDKEIVNILKKIPCEIDVKNTPDLVPVISAVAAVGDGVTKITGAKRLKIKESNRLESVKETLLALGADIKLCDDDIIIKGKKNLLGGTIKSFNDHRIVMMATIASIRCTSAVIIEDADAIQKSYPHFFDDFKKLGGILEVEK